MTVEELRKALENCAPGAQVWIYAPHCECWGPVQKVGSDGVLVTIEGANI